VLRLVINGADDLHSRGLLLLSALALAADQLAGVQVHILNGHDEVLRTAAACLTWDTGLHISSAPPDANPYAELAGATLYVAVATRSAAGLPLAAAEAVGVPSMVPVQFPGPDTDARTLSLVRAAHDPRLLAGLILDRLGLPE
jgi:hypothetical protein